MQKLTNTPRIAWIESEDGVMWATIRSKWTEDIRLMVERVPAGLWEWTAWRVVQFGRFLSGSASTKEAAWAAAEHAASDLAQ